MRFGENNVICPKYIDIYSFRGGWGGDGGDPPFTFCLLFKKTEKYKSMTYTKINSTLFSFRTIFPRMNNKNFTKRGPKEAPLPFLYKGSMVVLIDFIAILLTPGIFLIQIININNTNMYVICIYSKNMVKIHFPNTCDFRV